MPNVQSRIPALLSLLAMTGLVVSVIAGVIALYGDKNAYDHRWKLMERLRTEHGGDERLAREELSTQRLIRPPAVTAGHSIRNGRVL